MAIVQELHGRILTVLNRTSRSVGAVGRVIPPGKGRDVKLAQVQRHKKYMDELERQLSLGNISLTIDGVPVTNEGDTAQLDAPLSAEIQAAQDIFPDVPAASIDAIKVAFAAPTTDALFTDVDLDGIVGSGTLVPQRNITITGVTGIGEALTSKSIVITGLDLDGNLQTDTIVTTVLGASDTATDEGVIAFSRVMSINITADPSGSPGDYEIGYGNKLGLTRPLTIGGLIAAFADDTKTALGTTVLSGISTPNGTWEPPSAPNGSLDFTAVYVPG